MNIQCAEDLWRGLASDDQEQVLVLLEAVRALPERALALGNHQGCTLAERLEVMLQEAPAGSPLERGALRALASLPDDESPRRLWPRFQTSQDLEQLAAIAQALARLPLEWRREHLTPWLGGPLDPRSRLAANLLAEEPTPAVQVRSDRDDLPAPVFGPGWLNELRGPYRERAQLLLEGQTEELAAHFARLPAATQRWLLKRIPGRSEWMQPDADCGVLIQLLDRFEPPAWSLEHADPRVREVAARRAGSPDRWRSESDPAVQATYVGRLQDPEQLLEALGSVHWMVRAAASRAIARVGPSVLARLRRAVQQAQGPETRAACVQSLLWLEDDDWLLANLQLLS